MGRRVLQSSHEHLLSAPAMTTAQSDDFAAYATASIPPLRRLALLLCRNWHDAGDLVEAAPPTRVPASRPYSRWPCCCAGTGMTPTTSSRQRCLSCASTGTGPPRLTAPMLTSAPSSSGSLSGDGEQPGHGG